MKRKIRRSVDICMSVVLLLLMSYQITGEKYHEYLGVTMTLLVVVYIWLNRYWYPALFKGRYGTYRTIVTVIDLSLLFCFLATAFCGMVMSTHAVPFLYGILPVDLARRMHMGLSQWSFVLMGLHLGMHIPAIISQFKLRYSDKRNLKVIFTAAAAYGFSALIRNRIHEYLFFRTSFAFFDYDKSVLQVLIEQILIFSFFCFLGEEISSLTLMLPKKKDRKQDIVYTILCIALAIVIGITIAQTMN